MSDRELIIKTSLCMCTIGVSLPSLHRESTNFLIHKYCTSKVPKQQYCLLIIKTNFLDCWLQISEHSEQMVRGH